MDISEVALERAARRATAAGVAGKVTWERLALGESFPAGAFDLVTAHYLHSPRPTRRVLALQQAAGSVAPGGSLLLVGHSSVAPWSRAQHGDLPTAREVLEELGVAGDHPWQVVVCEDRPRAATGPGGEFATVTDSVLRLARAQGDRTGPARRTPTGRHMTTGPTRRPTRRRRDTPPPTTASVERDVLGGFLSSERLVL